MWPFSKKSKPESRSDLPDSMKEFEKRFNYICKREGVFACYIAVVPNEQEIMCGGGDPGLREIVRKKFAGER